MSRIPARLALAAAVFVVFAAGSSTAVAMTAGGGDAPAVSVPTFTPRAEPGPLPATAAPVPSHVEAAPAPVAATAAPKRVAPKPAVRPTPRPQRPADPGIDQIRRTLLDACAEGRLRKAFCNHL